MNTTLMAVAAVAMIGLGIFGLIGLWAYGRMTRRDSDLIVVHRFKSDQRRKRARRALAAPAAPAAPGDDSLWQRPGGPLQPKPVFFGEGKPRHVRIDNTPHVIIPHETVGPELGHGSYRRAMPAVRIKPVDVSPEQPRSKPVPKTIDAKPNKSNKSNHTMPIKRIP